jgi:tetratricopeptide (TPR) repeat protein
MLRLRPGNTPAFLHAAELREVFGEQQGALQLLQLVLDASSPADANGRAAILTRMARIDLETGDVTSAETAAETALALQAGNSKALLIMAQLRLLQGRPADAVPLIRLAYKSVSQTQALYVLGSALEQAGMHNEATKTYSLFEEQARAEISQPANANRELVFYYADHANTPAKALAVAEQEIAVRHDVHTLDAYAWALYKSGHYAEAKRQMDLALKVGVREAGIFYHAGEIELRLGNTLEASRLFKNAVELKSLHSQDATIALASLSTKLTSSK